MLDLIKPRNTLSAATSSRACSCDASLKKYCKVRREQLSEGNKPAQECCQRHGGFADERGKGIKPKTRNAKGARHAKECVMLSWQPQPQQLKVAKDISIANLRVVLASY